MKPLTKRQWQALSLIQQYTAANGFPPSERDIGSYFGMSRYGARCHVKALIAKGHLTHTHDVSRGLTVVSQRDERGKYIFAELV